MVPQAPSRTRTRSPSNCRSRAVVAPRAARISAAPFVPLFAETLLLDTSFPTPTTSGTTEAPLVGIPPNERGGDHTPLQRLSSGSIKVPELSLRVGVGTNY